MILVLIALPLAACVLVLFLRRLRLSSAVLTAGTLAILTASLLAQRDLGSWTFFGRVLNLPSSAALVLAYCCGLLALTSLYSAWAPQGILDHSVTLSAVALFIAAAALRNVALATLLLEGGLIASAMLVPSDRPGAPMSGMRALVLLVLCGPMLLVAAWAAEQYSVRSEDVRLLQSAAVSVALGYGIGLGLVPWHVWQPAIYQHGRALAAVMLTVVAPAILLLHLGSILQTPAWSGLQAYVGGFLLLGGALTAIAASLMVAWQRSLGRAVAFAALADLGLALIGLGLGPAVSSRVVLLHLAYRGIALAAALMAAGVLGKVLGGDDLERLRGAFRRAPLAMLGLVVGSLSLAGLPLTAGFTTRLSLYVPLLAARPTWGVAVIAASLAPVWAVARFCLAAWISTPVTGEREPIGPGLLIASFSLLLLALGMLPSLLSGVSSHWLDAAQRSFVWP